MGAAAGDGTDGPNRSDLRNEARHLFSAGQAAWPGLALNYDVFELALRRHATSASQVRDLHAADLYLAYSCGHGVNGSIVAFERRYASDMARAVTSIDSSPAFVEEIMQSARERLLVRKGSAPGKIVEYAGRASLKSWLCAVVVRMALSERRGKRLKRGKALAAEDDSVFVGPGPDFEYLRGRYKRVFEEAVRDAIRALPTKERLLLRLNVIDGMSIDDLGRMYGVGRSTAARWLAGARRQLLHRARSQLRTRLRLTSTELESLGADMRSQLEVSVRGLLIGTDDQR
jgi:RNA polymerase sigma-70 factor, ECF subfamily